LEDDKHFLNKGGVLMTDITNLRGQAIVSNGRYEDVLIEDLVGNDPVIISIDKNNYFYIGESKTPATLEQVIVEIEEEKKLVVLSYFLRNKPCYLWKMTNIFSIKAVY
jgi:hypothetical protein